MKEAHYPAGSAYGFYLDLYTPPQGINSGMFEGIHNGDFLLKKPKELSPDPEVFHKQLGAVWDTAEIVDGLKENRPELITTRFTEKEKDEHLSRYVHGVVDAIQILADESGTVSVSAAPVGGLAPLHAVMHEVATNNPALLQKTFFTPFGGRNSKYDEMAEKVRACNAHIQIDDGFASGRTQATLLNLWDNSGSVDRLITILNQTAREKGTCNAPELSTVYNELIRGFEKRNVLVIPFYNKNWRFLEELSKHIGNRSNSWAYAQSYMLDPNITVLIDEHTLAVGAMMGSYPCRDLGVSVDQMTQKGVKLDPTVLHKLSEAGMLYAENRLLANRKSLDVITPDAELEVMKYFAEMLNVRLAGRKV